MLAALPCNHFDCCHLSLVLTFAGLLLLKLLVGIDVEPLMMEPFTTASFAYRSVRLGAYSWYAGAVSATE